MRRRAVEFGIVFRRQNAGEGQSAVGKYSAKLLILIGSIGDFLPFKICRLSFENQYLAFVSLDMVGIVGSSPVAPAKQNPLC